MSNKPGALKTEKQETSRNTNAPGAQKSKGFLKTAKEAINGTVKSLGGWNGILTKTGDILDEFNIPIAGGIVRGVGKIIGSANESNNSGNEATSEALWDQSPAVEDESPVVYDESPAVYDGESPAVYSKPAKSPARNPDGTVDMKNKTKKIGDSFDLIAGWHNPQTDRFGSDAFIPIIIPGKF